MLTGTNSLILDNLVALRRRHCVYCAGFHREKHNHWIDVARSRLDEYRNGESRDAFALLIAAKNGGPDDCYVIPFARLAAIFGRTPPNKKSGVWSAHVVDGWFYFTKGDEVQVHDCHGSLPGARRIVETTLSSGEADIRRALSELLQRS